MSQQLGPFHPLIFPNCSAVLQTFCGDEQLMKPQRRSPSTPECTFMSERIRMLKAEVCCVALSQLSETRQQFKVEKAAE